MPTPHLQRVAWDGARVIVHASADNDWAVWFANWLNQQAGPPWGQLVMDSRARMVRGYGYESAALESGLWRVRLGDLMEERPDLVRPLAEIFRETTDQLRAAAA
ncbi:hypothetical protein ACFFX1_15575 [Dactylosporangium sucinum]|uniref:Uncharacterized protein n=1 Tax=Dactylosporangium sucinum TaxID=1424081 RepID=A0A917WXG9_9ACTN|nr:hypothetical protein [Dactylosporangium sucinum]GGM38499.1 hypothetical protein GCM10007977_044950 [Dactylosporangium sucinum]